VSAVLFVSDGFPVLGARRGSLLATPVSLGYGVWRLAEHYQTGGGVSSARAGRGKGGRVEESQQACSSCHPDCAAHSLPVRWAYRILLGRGIEVGAAHGRGPSGFGGGAVGDPHQRGHGGVNPSAAMPPALATKTSHRSQGGEAGACTGGVSLVAYMVDGLTLSEARRWRGLRLRGHCGGTAPVARQPTLFSMPPHSAAGQKSGTKAGGLNRLRSGGV